MEESASDKLARKMRDAPFLPAGILGFIGALGYGAYKYRHRGDMSRSLFFVQLRVGAQSVVVGALCVGIIMTMTKRILFPPERKEGH